jgi:hypothetical protein
MVALTVIHWLQSARSKDYMARSGLRIFQQGEGSMRVLLCVVAQERGMPAEGRAVVHAGDTPAQPRHVDHLSGLSSAVRSWSAAALPSSPPGTSL